MCKWHLFYDHEVKRKRISAKRVRNFLGALVENKRIFSNLSENFLTRSTMKIEKRKLKTVWGKKRKNSSRRLMSTFGEISIVMQDIFTTFNCRHPLGISSAFTSRALVFFKVKSLVHNWKIFYVIVNYCNHISTFFHFLRQIAH